MTTHTKPHPTSEATAREQTYNASSLLLLLMILIVMTVVVLPLADYATSGIVAAALLVATVCLMRMNKAVRF